MSKLFDFLCNPLVVFLVFLAGIGYNAAADVPAEGLGRLVALIPSFVLLVLWIATSSARNKAGK